MNPDRETAKKSFRWQNEAMSDDCLTAILQAAHAGDRVAADRAYAALYPELIRIARARLRSRPPETCSSSP